MIRLLVFLAVATVVALVAVWFAENPGAVSVRWLGWQIETSFGLLVLAALVLMTATVALFELLRWLAVLPGRWQARRRHAQELRGYRALSTGLIAAAAGDVRAAKLMSRTAGRLLPDEQGVLLLDAQAAQLAGDEETAQLRFRQMLRDPVTEALGVRGLLAQAIKTGDRAEALELARRAVRASPNADWAVKALFDLLTKEQQWTEALPLVDRLESLLLIDQTTGVRYRAVLNTLMARERLDARDAAAARSLARRAFRGMPSFAPGALAATTTAQALGHSREARRVLEQAWQVAPHPELAKAYADLEPGEPPAERLRRFARLERRNPGHPETLLTIAELAIGARQFARARELLRKLTAERPTIRACHMMAELERSAGGAPEAVEEWRRRAEQAEPDPAWVAESTGDILPAWQPFGPDGRFDDVSWTVPPRLSLLLTPPRPTFLLTQAPEPPAEAPPRQSPLAVVPKAETASEAERERRPTPAEAA
jgi:HemY protein